MNHFITGKRGFIGSHVVNYLKEKGENIVDTLQEADVIIHLAAYGNHSFQTDVKQTVQANITDLYNLITTARQIGRFQKMYNISSSSVTLPKQTVYSASKLMGEVIAYSFNDIRIVNVRPYSVYGPGEAEHRFIPTVIRHLLSEQRMQVALSAVHDWIYVTDFVEAMFNGYTEIGTGIKRNNLDVVDMLEKISGRELNFERVVNMREYDNADWVCPEGVPARSLYEGLEQTFNYYAKK